MVTINGKEYYYDGYLKDNLDILKERVAKDWDGVLYLGGYEGDGKSELGEQVAFYLDNNYCLARCVFTAEQFSYAIDHAGVGEAVVLDEGQGIFDSHASRQRISLLIRTKMTRIRYKRLYIIIIAPDMWRINKYLFIHRSQAFIHVYAVGTTRGYFAFFNREKKHELYIKGKKEENILCVSPNFRGRFTHWTVIDRDAYRNKKLTSEETGIEKPITEKQLIQTRYDAFGRTYAFYRHHNMLREGAGRMLAEWTNIHEDTLYRWAKGEIKGQYTEGEHFLTLRTAETIHNLPPMLEGFDHEGLSKDLGNANDIDTEDSAEGLSNGQDESE